MTLRPGGWKLACLAGTTKVLAGSPSVQRLRGMASSLTELLAKPGRPAAGLGPLCHVGWQWERLQLPEASAVLPRVSCVSEAALGTQEQAPVLRTRVLGGVPPDYPGSCPGLKSLPSVSSAVSSLSPRKVTWAQALGTRLWTSLGAILQRAMCPPKRNGEAGILSSVQCHQEERQMPGRSSHQVYSVQVPGNVGPASVFFSRVVNHALVADATSVHLFINPSPFTVHSLREVAGAGAKAGGKT